MRKPALLLGLALGACAGAPQPPMSPAQSLAAAESAFAAHSVREGMRAAFMAHFADDGVFVRDGWRAARAWLGPRPEPPIVLDWRPVHVEVAVSGDFGLSTGPWKLTSTAKPGEPPAYGQFVSIWKRESAGPWKVAVDLGISHPDGVLWDAQLRASASTATSSSGTIDAAEGSFARDARTRGLHAAYAGHAASDVRFYRTGAPPALGKAAMLARDIPEAKDWIWSVEQSETARTADFGYARGRYAAASAPDKPLGYFMRAWRFEAPAWRIVLDVVNPAAQ